MSASSSNTGLVSGSGIVLGGSGSSRTVTITPVANKPTSFPSDATTITERSDSPSAARGWRPSVMSESNCSEPAEKPSRSVSASKQIAPSPTSIGPACSRSPAGLAGACSRGISRTPSSSLTTQARRDPNGSTTGSQRARRPLSHRSPSGR